MSSMMADSHFRGGGTILASIFANMRSIREALGAKPKENAENT
jgi:hypothetical protein